MSEDVTPEWVRVKREMESLWKGAWSAIGDLWAFVHDIEARLETLERNFERSNSRPIRWNSPRHHRPLDED